MHGLRLEIQQRYFSIELLLHGFGTAAEELEALAGSTRHFWGRNGFRSVGRESDIIVKARSEAGVW